MKQPTYPSPCLACENVQLCTRQGRHAHCQDWRKWWLWWWKYFQQNLGKVNPEKKHDKFRYEHPDHIRKELAKHPCDSCFRKEFCTKPCYKYLAWYDARIKIVRKRLGI